MRIAKSWKELRSQIIYQLVEVRISIDFVEEIKLL